MAKITKKIALFSNLHTKYTPDYFIVGSELLETSDNYVRMSEYIEVEFILTEKLNISRNKEQLYKQILNKIKSLL